MDQGITSLCSTKFSALEIYTILSGWTPGYFLLKWEIGMCNH